MSLAQEARDIASARLPGPTCSVQKAMLRHPDLADQIAELIRAHDIGPVAAEQAMQRRDIDITHGTVARHRENKCRNCFALGYTW